MAEIKKSDWATYSLMEAPYWKNGMTPEEYDVERLYYFQNIKDLEYRPLHMQMEEKQYKEYCIAKFQEMYKCD